MEKSKPEIDKSEPEVHRFKPEIVSPNSIINVDEKDIVIEELPAKSLPKEVETLKSETDKTASKVPVPATRKKKSQKNTNSSLFLIGSFNESNTDYSLIKKQK